MKDREPSWLNPEFPGDVPAVVFEHDHNGFKKSLSVFIWKANGEDPSDDSVGMLIDSEERDTTIGSIDGRLLLEGEEVIFFSHFIENESRIKPTQTRVPRAVGASIVKLITTGVVTRWISSPKRELSDHSTEMYENYLGNNPNLRVQFPFNSQRGYIVSRR